MRKFIAQKAIDAVAQEWAAVTNSHIEAETSSAAAHYYAKRQGIVLAFAALTDQPLINAEYMLRTRAERKSK